MKKMLLSVSLAIVLIAFLVLSTAIAGDSDGVEIYPKELEKTYPVKTETWPQWEEFPPDPEQFVKLYANDGMRAKLVKEIIKKHADALPGIGFKDYSKGTTHYIRAKGILWINVTCGTRELELFISKKERRTQTLDETTLKKLNDFLQSQCTIAAFDEASDIERDRELGINNQVKAGN